MILTMTAWALVAWASFSSSFVLANSSAPTAAKEPVVNITRGKTIYMSSCIACHNKDPNKKGSLGPELVGTPLEVFKIKVVTGNQYPEGYKPKRATKIMKKFPQFEKDIPSIFAWIQSVTAAAK